MPKEMPFDMKRMLYGGFKTIVEAWALLVSLWAQGKQSGFPEWGELYLVRTSIRGLPRSS
jgi:hypothetical protein